MGNNQNYIVERFGLSEDTQIRLVLQAMVENNGEANYQIAYDSIESKLNGEKLPKGSHTQIRRIIERDAVNAGYVYPYDFNEKAWRITPEGVEFLQSETTVNEEVIILETEKQEPVLLPVTVKGTAFENYVLTLLKKIYPNYAWYNQGQYKGNERGLDLIGSFIGESEGKPRFIGVQVKFHSEKTLPSDKEWLKFLAGCFARRIELAIFVTSNRLTSEQRREAGEAGIIVIEGKDEITRIAMLHNIEEFYLFSPQTTDEANTEIEESIVKSM